MKGLPLTGLDIASESRRLRDEFERALAEVAVITATTPDEAKEIVQRFITSVVQTNVHPLGYYTSNRIAEWAKDHFQ